MMRTLPVTPAPFSGLHLELDRLFNDVFGSESERKHRLPVDLWETDDGFALQMAMPGVNRDDVEVLVQDDAVTIRGRLCSPTIPEGAVALRRECEDGPFERVLTLPAPIDDERVAARFDNGMLQVELPKAVEAKPRRIEVKG